jgi:hypothetical protein
MGSYPVPPLGAGRPRVARVITNAVAVGVPKAAALIP